MKAYKGIYRDENALELNRMLENLYEDLADHLEGICDAMTDITEGGLKEPEEMFNTPEDCMTLIILRETEKQLLPIYEDVKNILYSDFEEISLGTEKPIDKVKARKSPVHNDWQREDIENICLRAFLGETYYSIAESYNVDKSTITKVLQSNKIENKKAAKEHGEKILSMVTDLTER